jgi:hypothetical protein
MSWRRFWSHGLLAATVGWSCTTNTAGLARRDPEQSSGGAGTPGLPTVNAVPDAPPEATGGAAGAGPERSGPVTLSVLNGVVDGGSLWLCRRDATTGTASNGGLPAPSGGIEFGHSAAIEVDWDVASTVQETQLFVALLAQVEGRTCDELQSASAVPRLAVPDAGSADGGDAGGPEAPSVPFPVEPVRPRPAGAVRLAPGALRAGGHYLLVASGCATPGVLDANEACGPPDPFLGPPQALLLVEVPTQPIEGVTRFGLQFLNASRAISRAGVVLQGETQHTASVNLASEVSFGAVRPRDVATADVPAGIELRVAGSAQSDYTQLWSDTVTSSQLDPWVFGRSYLLVYVGPAPSLSSIPGLARPRFALVSSQ